VVKEEEKGAPRWGGVAPFIAARGGGRRWRGGGNRWVGKWRRRHRCLRAVGAVGTRSASGSDRAADGGPHAVLIFLNLIKTGSNLEF
jgi:hypothetical protein